MRSWENTFATLQEWLWKMRRSEVQVFVKKKNITSIITLVEIWGGGPVRLVSHNVGVQ